jgi:two-component system, LytTR family, response regulator
MTHKLTTIIVDDEPLARTGLAVRLEPFTDIEIVASCRNGREALQTIALEQPDLMFLDIQMPGLSGFEVIEEIINQGLKMPIVVFVTAFDQFALQAFEVHAVDYLMKPADEQRIEKTITKVREHRRNVTDSEHKTKLIQLVSDVTGSDKQQILAELDSKNSVSVPGYSDILAIKDVGEVTRVAVKEIIWIDAAGDYMCVHTEQQTHILRQTMKQLELALDPRQFVRSHRSVIVNKHFVEKFCNQLNGEYYLVLKNGKELKVSRSYKDKVKQAIAN